MLHRVLYPWQQKPRCQSKNDTEVKPHCSWIMTASFLFDGCRRVIADVKFSFCEHSHLLLPWQLRWVFCLFTMCVCICENNNKSVGTSCHMESISYRYLWRVVNKFITGCVSEWVEWMLSQYTWYLLLPKSHLKLFSFPFAVCACICSSLQTSLRGS